MKILVYAGSCAKLNYSFIAPMRIIRACHRAGDEVILINWADNRIPSEILKEGEENLNWGKSYTLSLENMIIQLEKTINEWKPDIVYSMGYTQLENLIDICEKYSIPLGLHFGDPFYGGYPHLGLILLSSKAAFLTFNEGQAMNYIMNKYPYLKDKCHLLNHAIDPELVPPFEIIKSRSKEYICSMVGGDDRIRRKELITYFYQWTNEFPEQKFAIGGSLGRGCTAPYGEEELVSHIKEGGNRWNHTTFTLEEVLKFKDKTFNLTRIENDLPYPLGLSHKATHKLYSFSYYGFTPYGHYLRKGWQSEYNMMTFGTKIFEMGGSGCAMIANKIKDLEKVIIHGDTGFIFDKPEDAHKAFKLAVDKPKMIKQMGINAYRFIHKHHSWDVRYDQVLKKIFRTLGINGT